MGSAAFPNGIASFSTKRDNTDINYAADVNRLQDEIVAIEESLGPLFNSITTLQVEEAQLQSGLAAQVTQEQTDFANLKDALLYAMTGQWIPCAQTWTAGGQYIAPVPQSSLSPTPVTLNTPGPDTDPDRMWNGSGFTLRKSGFWSLEGFVTFHTRDSAATSNNLAANEGKYDATLLINGVEWFGGTDRGEITIAEQSTVYLNTHRMGWFPAGTTVSLAARQTSSLSQPLTQSSLAVTCLRLSGTQWTSPLTQSVLQQLSG